MAIDTSWAKVWGCQFRVISSIGFLIAAYRTSAIKEGEQLWHK
jgi:hypothetical protein